MISSGSQKKFERKKFEHKNVIPKGNYSRMKLEIIENVQIKEKKLTLKDSNFILNSLKRHFVFYRFSDSDLENIIKQMFFCEAEIGNWIFEQNDNATTFFIIEQGTCQVVINGQNKRILSSGDGFGDLALLYNSPRSGGIQALEKISLWGIDRNTFKMAIEEISGKDYEINRTFINDIKFFKNLTDSQKDGIAGVLILQKFNKDQNIVCEGDPGNSYYIIKEGSVSVLKGEKEVRRLIKGDSFGEQALYYNCARTMTCRSVEDNTKCLALGRDMMVKILGDGIQMIILRNAQRWSLEKSSLFSKLNKIIIEKILDSIKIYNYKAGDILIPKSGLGSSKIIIVLEGAVRFKKMVVEKGGIFGDEFFFEENQKKIISDNLVVEKDSSIGELSLIDFQQCIGGKLSDVLMQSEKLIEIKKNQSNEISKKKTTLSMELKDFTLIKKLGAGQFGSVYLVKPQNSKDLFALKSIDKKQVIDQNLHSHIQQERLVCDMVNFPMTMQFMRTYKTQSQIFFLLEFIKGLELFDVIRDIGLLTYQQCQFYIGSMILAIEYLHSLGIIYRDIKPENIMISAEGNLKLIDMGTAKILKGKPNMTNRTFTILGTPHYMAPEIIGGKGYTCFVDLWSIGVCLYEFMCGMVPFGEEIDDPYELYELVVKQPVSYPAYFKDKKSQKFIDQLLNKIPDLRLGGSYTSLKANAWFDKFDWDKLIINEFQPPYVPKGDKLISDKEIEKLAGLNKNFLLEITKEKNQNNNKNGSLLKNPKSPRKTESTTLFDWDKDF